MKLRVSHLHIQAVLVWDDGQSLKPGPSVNALVVGLEELDTVKPQIQEAINTFLEKEAAEKPKLNGKRANAN